jgi:hypothetical protein
VINYKWGFIPAIFAMLISVMLGSISGAGFSHIFLRALVFAAVFFGLGLGMWFVVNAYFPEILVTETDTNDTIEKGSRVNITIDNTGEYAVPELYKASGAPDELGNIEDLISGTFHVESESVDRNQEERYNNKGVGSDLDAGNIDFGDLFQDQGTGDLDKPVGGKPVFTPSFVGDAGDLGGLPDLDAMSMAFSSMGEFPEDSSPVSGGSKGASSGLGANTSFLNDIEEADSTSSRYNTGNKPQPLKGDFNPEELAKGIRTVLNKDK